ncbi:RING-type E3 ubiquitin transferase [Trifolium repens]|nr:RING-type E3 ubiquitin transferase [Trifolium repens]
MGIEHFVPFYSLKIQTGVNLAMICFQYPINFQFNRSTCIFSEAPPTSNIGEEIKLKALIETPSLDWQHQVSDFGPGRGFGSDMGGCIYGGWTWFWFLCVTKWFSSCLKPNEAAFEKEIEGMPSTRSAFAP